MLAFCFNEYPILTPKCLESCNEWWWKYFIPWYGVLEHGHESWRSMILIPIVLQPCSSVSFAGFSNRLQWSLFRLEEMQKELADWSDSPVPHSHTVKRILCLRAWDSCWQPWTRNRNCPLNSEKTKISSNKASINPGVFPVVFPPVASDHSLQLVLPWETRLSQSRYEERPIPGWSCIVSDHPSNMSYLRLRCH